MLVKTTRFLWRATRGHRLQPWRSPYLRWRVETYTGVPAEHVKCSTFLALAWRERRQMARFAGWLREMAKLADGSNIQSRA